MFALSLFLPQLLLNSFVPRLALSHLSLALLKPPCYKLANSYAYNVHSITLKVLVLSTVHHPVFSLAFL
jgi:hypothetical protein